MILVKVVFDSYTAGRDILNYEGCNQMYYYEHLEGSQGADSCLYVLCLLYLLYQIFEALRAL